MSLRYLLLIPLLALSPLVVPSSCTGSVPPPQGLSSPDTSVRPDTAAMPRCHYEAADSIRIEQLLASGHTEMVWFARQFLGQPYVAHTLELFPDDERLIVNTRELDCTTFVELIAALTACSRRGETAFGDVARQMVRQRYWGGQCDGYTSRIHYFSDWIRDNSSLGIATEIQQPQPPFTAVQRVSVSYMSVHPDKYVALSRHPELVPLIARQEADLSGHEFRYIPAAELKNTVEVRQAVHDGDIIGIVTTAPGLDISHLGIAVWKADGLHFIDASSRFMKVVEEEQTMQQYLARRKSTIGIRVVRLVE